MKLTEEISKTRVSIDEVMRELSLIYEIEICTTEQDINCIPTQVLSIANANRVLSTNQKQRPRQRRM